MFPIRDRLPTTRFPHIGGFVAGLVLCLPWIKKARCRKSYRW
jgi:hypothetical protein